MKFNGNEFNWQTLINNEVLGPFCPNSGWIVSPKEIPIPNKPTKPILSIPQTRNTPEEEKLGKFLVGFKSVRRTYMNSVQEQYKTNQAKEAIKSPLLNKKSHGEILICDGNKVRINTIIGFQKKKIF